MGAAAGLLATIAAAQVPEAATSPASAPAGQPAQSMANPPAPLAKRVLLLRPPTEPALLWRGMLATEGGAVGGGQQIGPYPVPGIGGLLVAILTHAAINEGVKSAEQKRLQAEADKVLEPYQPALAAWPAASLWNAVQAQAPDDLDLRLADIGQGPAEATAVVLLPSFTLSQDESVLIADVALRFEAAAASVERWVRVVSSPLPTAALRTQGSANEALVLKKTASAMVVHALQVGHLYRTANDPEPPARTHRYRRGKAQDMERGQLVHSACDRLVVRTLRGHLLSVPRAEPESTPCPQSPGF